MRGITYIVRGRTMNADDVRLAVGQVGVKPKVKTEARAEFHKGWIVEGYPPGLIAEKQREREAARKRWARMSAKDRAASGAKEPKPFDLDAFLATTKRKRVRSRPFESQGGAEDCKAYAERMGWEYVLVTGLAKGHMVAVSALF